MFCLTFVQDIRQCHGILHTSWYTLILKQSVLHTRSYPMKRQKSIISNILYFFGIIFKTEILIFWPIMEAALSNKFEHHTGAHNQCFLTIGLYKFPRTTLCSITMFVNISYQTFFVILIYFSFATNKYWVTFTIHTCLLWFQLLIFVINLTVQSRVALIALLSSFFIWSNHLLF